MGYYYNIIAQCGWRMLPMQKLQGAGRRLKFELQGKNRQRNHSEMFFETAGKKIE